MKERREVSPEIREARQAASEVEGLEARFEQEKARRAAKSRQHKKEINKKRVHVLQGGAMFYELRLEGVLGSSPTEGLRDPSRPSELCAHQMPVALGIPSQELGQPHRRVTC